MEARRGRLRALAVAILMAMLLSANCGTVRAQVNESDVPETSVVPSEESPPPRPASRRVSAPAGHQAGSPSKLEVEPAHAVVKLNNDTAVLAQPDKTSKQIEQAQGGKFRTPTHFAQHPGLKVLGFPKAIEPDDLPPCC